MPAAVAAGGLPIRDCSTVYTEKHLRTDCRSGRELNIRRCEVFPSFCLNTPSYAADQLQAMSLSNLVALFVLALEPATECQTHTFDCTQHVGL